MCCGQLGSRMGSKQSDRIPMYLAYVLGPTMLGHVLTPLRPSWKAFQSFKMDAHASICQHFSNNCQIRCGTLEKSEK